MKISLVKHLSAGLALLFLVFRLHAQPIITTPPTNQVLAVGATLALSVTADGTAPLAYQWFKDSHFVLGATNSTLTVTNAGVTDSGTYFVAVTNLAGMAISLPVRVTVGNPTLLAWGFNVYGQLGNGTVKSTNLPVTVASNVVAGAAGAYHSLFVTADGILYGMGQSEDGQLGNGAPTGYTPNPNPVRVTNNVVAVAAGGFHSLFVRADGTLWGMGNNGYGQLGNGAPISSGPNTNPNPNLVIVASNVVAVAAGERHSLFVTRDGNLWTMGLNVYGQLGNGTNTDWPYPYSPNPNPVTVASNVVAMAAGGYHSLFLKSDGTLWVMGWNADGQLGNGGTMNYNSFNSTPVSIASNVVAVAAGQYHSLFVKSDGTLWATGWNYYGQLGNGMTNNINLPVNVASNVTAAAAGWIHSLLMKSDGALWAMGGNVNGQFGNGTMNNSLLPVSVPHLSLANIFPVAAADNSLATGIIRQPANVTLTNLNQTFTGEAIPVTVNTTPAGLTLSLTYNGSSAAPTNVGSYTVIGTITDPNYYGSATNTLVIAYAPPTITAGPTNQILTVGGTLTLSVAASGLPSLTYQWFKDGRLLLGATNSTWTLMNAAVGDSGMYFVVVTGGGGMFISLPASVVVGNPLLLGWGWDPFGALGNSKPTDVCRPVILASNVVTGAAGGFHSLFVKTDGTLCAMGYNGYGELGNGTSNDTNLPISVASNVVAVAGGSFHSLFIKKDGTLWAMGWNAYGQLGNGSLNDSSLPVRVASNVVAVAAGNEHSLFVTSDGRLWAMGYNGYGELGNGTNTASPNPTPVSIASNVVTVTAGGDHSLFVKNDRTLWAMGWNSYGQLGNGTRSNSILPVCVATNVLGVAAGGWHSLFLTSDGTMWGMGYIEFGQLGTGPTNDSVLPINIESNTVAVAAMGQASFFVMADGTLWGMGLNTHGQLGNGTVNIYSGNPIPVKVPRLSVASIFPASNSGFSLALGIIQPPTVVCFSTNSQQLVLQLAGTPSYPYILQTASNLTPPINWQAIITNSADTNGNWSFTVTNLTTTPGRFFRAVGQ